MKMNIKLIVVLVMMLILGTVGYSKINNAKTTTEGIHANANIPNFAQEGEKVSIKVTLDREINEDIILEEYTFHYAMYPEIALEQDTWTHKKQMDYMQNVLDGKISPYTPSLESENIKKILDVSQMKTYTLEQTKKGAYILNWDATHGRIFYRIKAGDRYTDNIYTTRVHCAHVDMRSFEKLKNILIGMATPLEHRNQKVVESAFEKAYSIYTKGHSPRFMLQHHERPIQDLDMLFDAFREKVAEDSLDEAEKIRKDILATLIEKEDIFYKLNAQIENNVIKVSIQDNINDFSFYDDPNTELYIKAIQPSEEKISDMVVELHDTDVKHDKSHINQGPDNEKLLEGALPLKKEDGVYKAELDKNLKGYSIKVVIIYGSGQEYYITKIIPIFR